MSHIEVELSLELNLKYFRKRFSTKSLKIFSTPANQICR